MPVSAAEVPKSTVMAPIVLGIHDPPSAYPGRLAGFALSYAVARTVLFSLTHAAETRYVIEAVPLIEAAVVMWIARKWRARRRSSIREPLA